MISERMGHPLFDDKAKGTAIDESHTRKSPIDTLLTELLERVIGLGATKDEGWRPEIKWICEWRRVSRKWASVIDHCSALKLWSYIVVSGSTGHVRTQLEKSKEAPLVIRIGFPHPKEEWIRLLFENVHRWKAITFRWYWTKLSAMLDSPPPVLEVLAIHQTILLPDSKFFNHPSPNLRSLELSELAIHSNIQPIFGLEELCLSSIDEILEDGTRKSISGRKLHQFLQASPGLRVLQLVGGFSASAADKSLQPVDLPNLVRLEASNLPQIVLNLFRAEHCAYLIVNLDLGQALPPGAWTTVVPTLRRAKRLRVHISKYCLTISSLVEPPTIRLWLQMEQERGNADLSYSILEEILQELEYESCISARIQLSLYADEDISFKILKLLQSPMVGPSSRWKLPHLDTICIRGEGFPYQYLQEFVQARANAQGDKAPKAVTSILQSDTDYYGPGGKEILGEVMDYAGDEGVVGGAVVQRE